MAIFPGGVALRLGHLEEIDALRAIEVDAGRRFAAVGLTIVAEDPPPPAAWYVEHLDAGRLWVAVAVAGADTATDADTGEPVGYAAASIVDGEGHLDQVSVLERWGGHGVGQALTMLVVEWARACSLHAVTLTTYRDLPWNGPWYRKLGFLYLDEEDLGPELAALRREERRRGLDQLPRVAMRLVLE